MGKVEMERLRDRLKLVDPGRVVLSFEHTGLAFECRPCESLLEWAPSSGWWACPACSYELTVDEAEEKLALLERALKEKVQDVRSRRPRKPWGLLTFFRALVGRSRSSS